MSVPYAGTWALKYTGPVNPAPNLSKFENYIILYNYVPSMGFNIFASIAWGLVCFGHCFHLRKRGTRVIQSFAAFGAFWEIIAYAVRAYNGSSNQESHYRADLFYTQFAINQVAVFLFYAAIHNALDNALRPYMPTRSAFGLRSKHTATLHNGEETANPVSIPWIPQPKYWIYILSAYNLAVFVITVVGACMLGHGFANVSQNLPQGNISWVEVGYAVLRTGLGNQVAMLTITLGFITWLVIATLKSRKSTSVASIDLSLLWLGVLFLTSGMLWMRTIFRLVEIVQGVFGAAWSSEALFGVFEFAPILLAVAFWVAYPIGKEGLRTKNAVAAEAKTVSPRSSTVTEA